MTMERNTAYPSRRWLVWLAGMVLFFAFLYAIKAILLPFIIGMLIAYFLDPAADRLEAWGLSRLMATLVITALFFGLFTLLLVLLIPVVITQLEDLVKTLPGYIEQYRGMIAARIDSWLSYLNIDSLASAREAVNGSSKTIASAVGKVTQGLLSSGAALVNLVSLIVITPIVAFYLLRDWDRIVAHIDGLLPRRHAATIREQAALMDRTLSGYIRGVLNVMLVLGSFYAVSLSVIGLDFAVLIGMFGGLMFIIPYLGTFLSGMAAVGMAYLQFDSWEPVLATLAVFTAGQMMEGYFLTPKLVGDKIGLHPLWLIFGMLAGAALFGFVGIFLAIPVTALLGVLIRFAVQQYKHSAYYEPDTPGETGEPRNPA